MKTMNTPTLRFKEFSGEWEVKTVNDLTVRIIDGDRGVNYPNGDDFSDDGYCLFLNAKNVTKSGFAFNELSFISKEKDEQLRKGKLIKNDLIITTRGTVGNIAYFDNNVKYENIRINSGMVIVRNESNDISSNYLYQYFYSPNIKKTIDEVSFGSAQPQLTVGVINKIKIGIPPLPEQTKIANFLTAIDEKIAQLSQTAQLLTDYKKGVMQQIFSQQLRFKDDNGREFAEWQEKKLNEITSYVDYRGKTPEKSDNGVFLVTAKNIRFGYIDYETSKEYIPEETYENVMRRGKPLIGDVLITTEAPFGNVASVDRDDIALAQRVIKLRGKKKLIQNHFLKFYLLSDLFQKNLLEKASGGTVKGIKGSVLHKMKIQFPSLPEQTKIANFLTAIDDKINHNQTQLDAMKQYKAGLLQQMFV